MIRPAPPIPGYLTNDDETSGVPDRNTARLNLGRATGSLRRFSLSFAVRAMLRRLGDDRFRRPIAQLSQRFNLFRMPTENFQKADGGVAGGRFATLILLKSPPASTDYPTRLFLREV